MWSWLVSLWAAWMNPFDWAPDEERDFTDRTPLEPECPTTQPTDWGTP